SEDGLPHQGHLLAALRQEERLRSELRRWLQQLWRTSSELWLRLLMSTLSDLPSGSHPDLGPHPVGRGFFVSAGEQPAWSSRFTLAIADQVQCRSVPCDCEGSR